MASYNKIQDYTEQLNKGVHNWSSHTFKAVFAVGATVATNTVLADLTHLSTGGGYTGGAGGGVALDTVTLTETTGTAKVTIADEVFTATGAAVGPFRYVTIYNDSATSPADALVCWYDYGSSITLNDTETFTIDFDPTNGLWQLV
jgi:acetyltransferase-like isoleucine patch superfamily enzyme